MRTILILFTVVIAAVAVGLLFLAVGNTASRNAECVSIFSSITSFLKTFYWIWLDYPSRFIVIFCLLLRDDKKNKYHLNCHENKRCSYYSYRTTPSPEETMNISHEQLNATGKYKIAIFAPYVANSQVRFVLIAGVKGKRPNCLRVLPVNNDCAHSVQT